MVGIEYISAVRGSPGRKIFKAFTFDRNTSAAQNAVDYFMKECIFFFLCVISPGTAHSVEPENPYGHPENTGNDGKYYS